MLRLALIQNCKLSWPVNIKPSCQPFQLRRACSKPHPSWQRVAAVAPISWKAKRRGRLWQCSLAVDMGNGRQKFWEPWPNNRCWLQSERVIRILPFIFMALLLEPAWWFKCVKFRSIVFSSLINLHLQFCRDHCRVGLIDIVDFAWDRSCRSRFKPKDEEAGAPQNPRGWVWCVNWWPHEVSNQW